MHRRRFLAAAAGGLGAGLAGCLGGGGNPNVALPAPDRERDVDSETLPYPAWGQRLPDVTVPAPLADGEVAVRDVDRPTLLTFFYSNCRTVCPRLVSSLRNVQAHAMNEGYVDAVRFLPVTFDPERDTGERLRAYGERMNVADPGWTWLRPEGRERARAVVRDEFGVNFQRTNPEDTSRYMFNHTGMTILANADGYVERAYRQSPGEILDPERMIDDLTTVRG